jgi:hypothetical protein
VHNVMPPIYPGGNGATPFGHPTTLNADIVAVGAVLVARHGKTAPFEMLRPVVALIPQTPQVPVQYYVFRSKKY